jgi:hypothetical protein
MTQPLNPAFNCAVVGMANRLFPCGYDVSDVAPSTFAELCDHIKRTGRICVWNGASDRTIFGSGNAEINYAFRAWHDWSHWRYSLDFTRDGEYAVAHRQMDHMIALYGIDAAQPFCHLIACEVIGQFDYREAYGDFPADQMEFARGWLIGAGPLRKHFYLPKAA